ncbi:MAG TPA: dipeptide epimerase [Nocardioidaceae bacterium]|nr:dipeptide epimerase [Nocardioidaceae bacterium]
MPVVGIRCRVLRAPLHTPFITALRSTTVLESLLVEVLDENGAHGIGEAPAVEVVTGQSLASLQNCVDGPLRSVVMGRDADDLVPLLHDVSRQVPGNPTARAAVDVALHDLAARRRGLSLPRFLGGTKLQVRTDVTVSAGEGGRLAAVARDRVADGFDVLKVKVGTDPVTDVDRVLAVRAAIGPAVTMRLDANQGWTPQEAVRVLGRLEDAGALVELVEQPVTAADIDGLSWVRHRVQTPVMADESVFGLRDLVTVISKDAADLVNIKLAKAGGLLPARALLELARAHGLGTMVGSMMEGPVGVGAAASLAAVHGTTVVSDLDAAWWLAGPTLPGGLRYESAVVHLPDSPGLGVGRL